MLGRSAGDRRGDDGSRLWGPNDPDRRITAWIGTSVVVRGHVTSSEDTTIAGRVEGDIEVRDNVLVIAPGAHVEGNIVARDRDRLQRRGGADEHEGQQCREKRQKHPASSERSHLLSAPFLFVALIA